MKHELKISRLAVVCVLCAAVSGAYGASSVRSLGGSGTYTSAAAAAEDGNSGGAASVRGGSLRVTPSSGVSGTTTNISAGNTTGGRVATLPRLSIGHYLGGGTSVSGGSSIRPITPGGSTSGGGSSSGGSGGVSSDDLDALRGQVDQLERDIEGLRTADDNFSDALLDKQDALIPGDDGYIIIDDATNEIFVDVDALEGALETVAGKDGREVELGSNDTHLLWRYVGESGWHELISKAEITGPQGPQGEKGEKGEPGDAANLDAYSTTEQMNQAIGNAIDALADVYATKAEVALKADKTELANYATSDDLSRGLAAKANAADVYTKAEVYNKTEVDDKVADIVAGDMDEALANKADKTYVDTQLATKADKTELANYATTESVTALDSEMDEVNATATEAALGAAQALSGLTGKEDTSNKTQMLTNSATDYPSTAAVTSALAGKANVDDVPTTVAELTDASNYVTTDGLSGAISTATENMVTDTELTEALDKKADKATTLAGYGITDAYTTAQIDEKLEDVAVGGMEGMEQVLAGKQDVANLVQVVSEADTTKYPSGAAVYKELETKANASELDTLEETVEQLTNAGYVTSDDVNTAVSDALTAVGAVTDANMAEKLDGYATDEEVQNAISTATTDMVTNSTLNTTLSNYATTANLNAKQNRNVGIENNGNILTVGADGNITTSTTIEQSAVNGLTDALDAKADASALDDYVTNDGLATAVDGALDMAGVVTEESLATKGFVTETQLNEKDYVTNSELATKGYATKADLDGKQDALGYTAENQANKTDDMTVDAGSTTKYPTVHAVEAYVTNTVAEGVDINTDQIDDGAITKPKLHQNLQAEIDGKANTADLGALAEKNQIKNADVADDAAIAKSKLALDVQTALDNAANAVAAPDGEKPANSILGTDGDGDPTWYEIVLE